jgi:hypothetical protein
METSEDFRRPVDVHGRRAMTRYVDFGRKFRRPGREKDRRPSLAARAGPALTCKSIVTTKVRPRRKKKRWSRRVTQTSNALVLERGVFVRSDPRRIALSLKRSAERSRRRKGTAYQSAMSMLTFYINRAGRNLPAGSRRRLERAKVELRALFGRA